ncbi:NADH dehydrogenase [ubiquinone] 1 alpha subcomplex subunit 7-like [Chelonus insularis]|uniref:NADH dehydrogenase [ubiquinone] 1 alpha subcomplex subunit 7-like n=1 Tax=Chelonus insularis TaxID=460826 RepID=UPI00158B4FB7|nr:NADH dehydrogenase [ubiquinone] 1 alpha subcomplex subunit 7-like [Chelonus insularis]XP_034943168.1 NADH dehydrogenase [ubiquinone] 1 alpha subcomplex subunit 7-like [Chelonus insularis]
MSGNIPHRDVGPIIQLIRRIARGRKYIPSVRFADELAARTQPHPNVPGGPYHKTSKIYYHTRDARRLVAPPIEVANNTNKQITAGSGVAAAKPITPNKTYHPQVGEPDPGKIYNEPFEL